MISFGRKCSHRQQSKCDRAQGARENPGSGCRKCSAHHVLFWRDQLADSQSARGKRGQPEILRLARLPHCYTCIAMLAIRLPQLIEARLEALAKATGRTKSFYAREAIVDHIEDLEDIYLAEQRLTEIRAGGETVSHARVMKKYGR